ncbi:MAG: DUF2849 domain-containing protein [Alphaproteobacteria bacterium]
MARQPKGPVAITGNRLDDGRVVYFTGSRWSDVASDAAIAQPTEADALLDRARAEAAKVIDPYAIEIAKDLPSRYREQLRAAGPSVRLDLGKQAGRP